MAIGALDLRASARLVSPSVPASIRSPRVVHLLHLALALLVIAQLGRFPVLTTGQKEAPLLFNDLLVSGLVAAGVLVALQRRRAFLDGPAALGLLFAGVGALSAALAIPRFELTLFQFTFSAGYLVRWLLYFGIYLVGINFIRRGDVQSVWGTLEAAVLVFAAFGIFQSLFLPGFAQMVYPEAELYAQWDPQGRRLVSTFLDPNFAGILIAMTLIVQLARLPFGVQVAMWKPVLLFAALILTLSRSSFFAFLCGGLVILVARKLSKRVLRVSALLSLLVIPFLPRILDFALTYNKLSLADPSLLARFVAWARAIQVFGDHPILGVGFNTYGYVQEHYGFGPIYVSSFGLDGGLLFIAVMTGVVGLLLYVGMTGWVLVRCRRVWRDDSRSAEDRALCLGTAAATVALVIHSLFLNSLLYPFLMEALWVLWALTFVVRQPAPDRRDDSPPLQPKVLPG